MLRDKKLSGDSRATEKDGENLPHYDGRHNLRISGGTRNMMVCICGHHKPYEEERW